MKQRKRRPETAAVRGASDLQKKNGPVAPEIYQTSTFEVADNEEQIRVTTTDRYYTRWGNPTIRAWARARSSSASSKKNCLGGTVRVTAS